MLKTDQTGFERLQERQKLQNDKSKYWAALIGKNMSLAVCFMIPLFLITLIWTETSLPKLGASLGMETVLTAGLFILAEWASINVGIPSGKLDDGYVDARAAFETRRDAIKARGILKMAVFCDWQIDEELVNEKKRLCRRFKINYREYRDELSTMTEADLKQKYGKLKAAEIGKINNLDPIELTPELILGERQSNGRGGIGMSGDEYVAKQKFGKMNLAKTILTVVFTVSIGFAISPGVTWGKIVFTLLRVIAVFMRMKVGFDKGARAFNEIEVRHLEAQIYYMDRYEEFLDTPGLYEAAAERYGTTLITPIPTIKEAAAHEVKTQYVDRAGDAENQPTREPDPGAEPPGCPAPVG